jgi:hypothetical protein
MKNNLENISSQLDLLKVLAKSKTKVRQAIIINADRKLIMAICEIVFNVLENNLTLDESDLLKIKRYRFTLRKLIKKTDLKEKKKILVQRGGFLQFLIPAVITGISNIVSSLIDSNKKCNIQQS